MSKEPVIPKAYVYTVEGVFDEEENLKKFSTASLSRDLHDEFDLESIAGSAALFFYLDNPEYQDPSKWPLIFKFLTANNPVELEMNLTFSPCFMSTPKKIIQEKKAVVVTPPVEKKTRKPRTKKEVPVKVDEPDLESILIEVKDFIAEYHGYLELPSNEYTLTKYGAVLKTLSSIDDLLTSVKAVSEEDVSLISIRYKEQNFNVQINPEFYHLLNPIEVFDPSIAEEGEFLEIPEEIVNDNNSDSN